MTLNINALKKSKIRYLLVLIVVLSMLFPSTVFAAIGDAPTLAPDITTSTTGKVTVAITFPSGIGTFLSKQFSLDNGVSWMDYTGPVVITDNTTMKAMYTYLNGSDTYSSQIGSLIINNITGRTSSDANNGNWASKNIQKNYTAEADAMVRVGDIDNFGFGFNSGYDPFSGNSTPVHSYPWTTPSDEPAGLDRIMEITGFNYSNSSGTDGYTSRYTNSTCTRVQPIALNYDLTGIRVTSAKLQMFVDDFQAGIKADNAASSYYRATDVVYKATINGVEVTELSSYINQLNQSGPIGKLISFNLSANYLQLIRSGTTGNLQIKIDDSNTARYGDGYAIDFVKLLINPKDVTNTSSISGRITDVDTNAALSGAKVTACGLTTTTDSNGNYNLPKLTPGLAVIQVTNPGYSPGSLTKDLVQNTSYTGVDFKLQRTQKPGIPVINESILVPTSGSVKMTIQYPDNPAQTKYSDNQVSGVDVWVDYTGSFIETHNCTVKAKSISAASVGSVTSDIATYDITNIDTSVPSAPILSPSTTAPTNGSVIVTAAYPLSATVKQISLDGGATWTSYNGPVTIDLNTTVVAKCANSLNTQSPETKLDITNINKNIPAKPVLTPDITRVTNGNVTIIATYPTDAATKEISVDGGTTWSNYTVPVVITGNTRVEARGTNSVGTTSQIAILDITNIDKSVPPTPRLVEDNMQPTNANVNVSASYDQVAVIKEISVDNGATWNLYTGAVVIAQNTTVQARCINAAGTSSLPYILPITNIDKRVPPAPVITPSTTGVVVVPNSLTVSVAYPNDASNKLISIDNGTTWSKYTSAVEIKNNTTVYATYDNIYKTTSDKGSLTISNIDTKPTTPTLTQNTNNVVIKPNKVTVTVSYPGNPSNKKISVDNKQTWQDYINPVEISDNMTIYAKSITALGTESTEGSLTISNIDTKPATPTLTQNTNNVVVKPNKVTVTVGYPGNPSNKKISVDNKQTWQDYGAPVEISDNMIVYAKAVTSLGTESTEGSLTISNIDIKPATPTLTQNTNNVVVKPNKVTVTVSYPGNPSNKKISVDNKITWQDYVNPVEISDNMIVYAKAITGLGTESEEGSLPISNIDTKPASPTFSQDVYSPTSGSVYVTVIPSAPGLKIQVSMDGNNWSDYTNPIKVTVNYTKIYAKCISTLGTESDIVDYTVKNIEKAVVAPDGNVNRLNR